VGGVVVEVGAVGSGTVVRFNGTNGYGFITPDDGGDDVFLHASLLPDGYRESIPVGTRVEYQSVASDRGPKAVSVAIVRRDPAPHAEDSDDQLCDVISAQEFAQKVTEVLIDVAPSITGAQITEVRARLLVFARQRGWVEN
jgi:CspA family cold shock protein